MSTNNDTAAERARLDALKGPVMGALEYDSITSLRRIRDAGPCEDGWTKLLAYLGKTRADGEPLTLLTILDSNGMDDALWVLSHAMPDDRIDRHFQAWCAEHVLHLFEAERPDDPRVRDQIAMLRRDDATEAERVAAWVAARAAACAAERTAAWEAAWASSSESAWVAARAAASAAASEATWASARGRQNSQLRLMLTKERAA